MNKKGKNLTLANVITGIRAGCALALIFCSAFSKLFYVLYIAGGISDVFDGMVARHFGKQTEFGAKFDTFADFFLLSVVLIKVLKTIYVPIWLIAWISIIAVIKFVNIIYGFNIRGHFTVEHSILNKICGVLLFVIPFCIMALPSKLTDFLVVLACVMTTVAAMQEGYYIHIGKEIY